MMPGFTLCHNDGFAATKNQFSPKVYVRVMVRDSGKDEEKAKSSKKAGFSVLSILNSKVVLKPVRMQVIHNVFDPLGAFPVADQQSVFRIDHDRVVHAYQHDESLVGVDQASA